MTRGKNINLFLMDGNATGRIKCTLANWTGVAYKIPRTMLEKAKNIKYLNQTGVYFLLGYSEENEKSVVYVGQAGIRKNGQGILNRLAEHKNNENKDYWTEAVAFTTSNDSFGPTEISYLENRFCNMAKDANRYVVKNEVEPTAGNITEEKESELEEFIDYSRIIMGALGCKVFEPFVKHKSCYQEEIDKEPLLYILRNSIDAKGKRTSDGFVILKGSKISLKETDSCSKGIKLQRKNAIKNENKISKCGIVNEDILFRSPSAAASFTIGTSANGLIEWKNKKNITLKELEKREI